MNSFHNPDRLVFRQSILPFMAYAVEEATTLLGSFNRYGSFC
jgi:hypothetical protein